MSSKHDSISEISPKKESWSIVAKVIRLWKVSHFSKPDVPFSMELLLMDHKGDKIHASVRRTLMYKFDKDLREGLIYLIHNFGVAVNGGNYRTCKHMYKLNFQFQTKVENSVKAVPGSIYSFVPIPQILSGSYDTDYLVDVMGMLTGVGTEREYEKDGKKVKLNVIAIDFDGQKIECTVFGQFVDELSTFIASRKHQNAVVIFHLAKVKNFQGKIHLQNCHGCTKIIYNAVSEEAIALRNRMNENLESPTQGLTQIQESGSVCLESDFLQDTQRKTIESLKELNEESTFVIYATVTHVIEEDDWWYTACICDKSVYPDHKMFFCEKCDKHVIKVEPRYRIKLRVIDETDCTTFVIWDRDVKVLLRKSCTDLFESQNKKSAQGSLPKEITDLVDKSFLFKVGSKVGSKMESHCKWEQSFNVKRICYDEVIMNKFNEMYKKSEDESEENVCYGGQKQPIIDSADNQIAQNLLEKCSTTNVDQSSQSVQEKSCDLSKDTEDLTPPLKRVSPDKHNDGQLEQPSKVPKNQDDDLKQSPKVANKIYVDLEIPPKIAKNNLSDLEKPLKVLKKNIKKEKE